jgi:hypothetical protein
MLLKLFLILLAAAPPPCKGHVKRSHKVRSAFMRLHPCPDGPDKGSTKRCRGWIIDHICPLQCCGLDSIDNLQWQSKADAKAKDRTEIACKDCCR